MSMRDDNIAFIGKPVKMITRQSDIDVLIEHFENPDAPVKLSAAMEKRKKQIERCHVLTAEFHSRTKVIPKLRDEFDISYGAALRIYEDTQVVFAHKVPKREYWIDIALGRVAETWRTAKAAGDIRGMNAADANMIAIMDKFLESADKVPFEEFKNPNFVLGWFPQLSKVAETLPENWRQIVERIIVEKRNRDLHVTDAEIIPNADE